MLWRDVPIKILLVAGFLISGLLPMMAVALMSLSIAREELNHQAFRQLESVRDLKKSQVQRYFDERARLTSLLAANPYIKETLRAFKQLMNGPEGLGRRGLRGHGKGRFTAPPAYLALHDQHLSFLHSYVRQNRYYDLFLMDPADGFTYFTVAKEADFGVALATVDSSLKDVWQRASSERRVSISDTRPYTPSGGIPAQFVAAPVMDGKKLLGVVAVQLSLDAIDGFMIARPGMGKTGETYLVGPDHRMRSDSSQDRRNHSVAASFAGSVDRNGINTLAVREAFAGKTGAQKVVDYRGRRALSAYAPVSFGGITWAIIAEIDEAEIDAKIAAALNTKITVTIFLSLALLLILALSISLFISKGIARVKLELNLLMDGVLSGRRDRIGDPERVAHDFRGVVQKTNELIAAYQAKTDESRQLAEAMAYNQRLEAIGTLAGGIAHDFNNILAYMLTYGDLVLDDLEEGSAAHERMQQILGGIDRAGELVAQIMTFGRQLKREKRPVEVALIVKEATKLLRATIPKNIKVQSDIGGTHTKVLADPPQLHQIVMNLCTNAFHAMLGSGGVMTVALGEETVSDNEQLGLSAGRYCVLSVADTGCGIEPDVMKRIFEPFFTTKPVGQGSGMGLAVVHGIVTSYGGIVTFESQLGVGTKALVYLPLAESAAAPEQGPERAKIVRGSGRLLFVDDEQAVCASTAAMLESLGYEVDALLDPLEALELFTRQPLRYAAAVADINMPKIDGVELARRLVALRSDLPVLLVTGYNDVALPETLDEAAHEILLKPFKKSKMSQILATLIAKASGGPEG